MNCVLWFVIYYTLLYAFVGQYIEYMKMRGMSSRTIHCYPQPWYQQTHNSNKRVIWTVFWDMTMWTVAETEED
jgi:hypothetical protein